jgi:hypothetical protein
LHKLLKLPGKLSFLLSKDWVFKGFLSEHGLVIFNF